MTIDDHVSKCEHIPSRIYEWHVELPTGHTVLYCGTCNNCGTDYTMPKLLYERIKRVYEQRVGSKMVVINLD